jgi:hypothetical protein
MTDKLTEKEYQQVYSILKEKLSYMLADKRNLFNFALLDKIEEDVMEMVKSRNFVIFRDYDNIYKVIDNFESNIGNYINNRLKELGDD